MVFVDFVWFFVFFRVRSIGPPLIRAQKDVRHRSLYFGRGFTINTTAMMGNRWMVRAVGALVAITRLIAAAAATAAVCCSAGQ